MDKHTYITREGLLELVEALRKTNANLRRQALMADEVLSVDLAAARAEVARLRTALENIANNMPDEPDDAYPGDMTAAEWKLIVTGRIVRAALKGETPIE